MLQCGTEKKTVLPLTVTHCHKPSNKVPTNVLLQHSQAFDASFLFLPEFKVC